MGLHFVEIVNNGYSHVSRNSQSSGSEQQASVAQASYGLEIVADEKNRMTSRSDFADLSQAFFLKRSIAHRQDLVNQKNLWLKMRGNRKRQAHMHPAGIMLDRSVEKFLYLRKVDDFIKSPIDLPSPHAQDSAVEINVLTPGKLRVESGANFEERPHAPIHFGITRSRFRNT